MGATILVKEVTVEQYQDLLREHPIFVNSHALFRLSQAQRKLFKEQELIHILKNQQPNLIGIQQNGRYAAFFKQKQGYMRIIFQLTPQGIEIGTFYNIEKLPTLTK